MSNKTNLNKKINELTKLIKHTDDIAIKTLCQDILAVHKHKQSFLVNHNRVDNNEA
jgi:hypothetical protein